MKKNVLLSLLIEFMISIFLIRKDELYYYLGFPLKWLKISLISLESNNITIYQIYKYLTLDLGLIALNVIFINFIVIAVQKAFIIKKQSKMKIK